MGNPLPPLITMRQFPIHLKEELRSEIGRGIAKLILDRLHVRPHPNQDLIMVHANRISLCNESQNLYLSENNLREDGTSYPTAGHLWQCGSKLCPSCCASLSRRNRKILRDVVQALPPLTTKERYSFLTLTIPNFGLPLPESASIVQYAWSLFRKRKWFTQRVTGYAKSEEFTITKQGIHYHLHAMMRREYWNYHSLRHVWTECVKRAFEKHGRIFYAATSDNMLIVKDKAISSFDSIIKELCKYMTKASSWRDLNADDLLEFAALERWPRMFELGFLFAKVRCAASDDEAVELTSATAQGLPIVHTKVISDGDRLTWRKRLGHADVETTIYMIIQQVRRTQDHRWRELIYRNPQANYRRATYSGHRDIGDVIDDLQSIQDAQALNAPLIRYHRKQQSL